MQVLKFCLSILTGSSALFISIPAFSQTPNWAQHIAPVFYSKCTGCHHAGGVAPFPLISYTDAQPWTSYIKTVVQSGKMPPWPPDTNYLSYVHQRSLSAQQINTIVTWVNNGAPQGNLSLAPVPPVYHNGTFLGTPDLKLDIPVYTSVATSNDKYQCFSLPTSYPQDRFIKAIEIVPGNKQIVHHVVMFSDTGNTVTVPTVDTTCDLSASKMLGVYVPGATPTIFPNGGSVKMGMRLKAGASIKLQIHYPMGTAGMLDSTSVHLFFYPVGTVGVREIYSDFLLGNWDLAIPPDSVKGFTAHYPDTGTTQANFSLLGVFPHMHLIGKEIESYAVGPLNDTTKFVKINNWDFHWQDFYNFKKIIKLKAGSKMYARAVYDNTVNNPSNPFSPPQWIYDGEATTEEMFLVAFQYLPYKAGDENVVLDSLLGPPVGAHEIVPSNFFCYSFPNPSSGNITLQYYLEYPAGVKMDIYDDLGRTVRTYSEHQTGGTKQITWNGKDERGTAVIPGIYFYRIETRGRSATGKMVIAK